MGSFEALVEHFVHDHGELVFGDLAIAVFVAEAGEEIGEHFLGSHLTALHLRVEGAVVDGGKVSGCDSTVARVVHLAEGLINNGLAHFVRCSANAGEEFVVVDGSVLVGVESFN